MQNVLLDQFGISNELQDGINIVRNIVASLRQLFSWLESFPDQR